MRRIGETWKDTVWTTRTVILAYLAIGGGLLLQPGRFANTPSYANLILIMSSQAWGCMYLAAVALLIAWRLVQPVWLGVVAHTFTLMVTLFWLLAFVIRYQTDDGTTIVNVVSWTVFLTLVIRSTFGMVVEIKLANRPDHHA